ncbi:hypothetical protein [Mucilaginibacter sp.]
MQKYLQVLALVLFISVIYSCKKDKTSTTKPVVDAAPVSLGLFEYSDGTNYRIFIPLTQIGTQTVNYDEVFDTGSAGLAIDAQGILPDSLITKNGFVFSGDSLVVDGITITSTKSEMDYGDNTDETQVKGNVAYANITIGNNSNGLLIKRVPIFLYYAIFDVKNGNTANETQLPSHSADIFGVSPEYSYASNLILSPLSYYKPGTGLTNGFKLAKMVSTDFTSNGVYEQNILTLGLTKADLASTSGFVMHNETYTSVDGYSPDVPGTITYNGNTISANFLFDTGTPEISIIENKAASTGILPASTTITLKTTEGFTYSYTTTSTTDITEVENPSITGDIRTIFSLEFFINNEYLTNYTGHQIGLKNN